MKRATKVVIGVAVGLAAAQLVSFERTNPKVTGELDAPPEVKAVLKRSCYDCHSNETVWPWYSRVAPASWLVHRDVVEGRRHVNFSEWAALSPEKQAHKRKGVAEEVREGDMPPWFYLPMHPAARLSDADAKLLEAWASAPPAAPKAEAAAPAPAADAGAAPDPKPERHGDDDDDGD